MLLCSVVIFRDQKATLVTQARTDQKERVVLKVLKATLDLRVTRVQRYESAVCSNFFYLFLLF